MGIVLDEYGSAVGVVTPMDILSAIAGHMGDVAPEPDSFRQPDGSWLLPGRMAVDEGLHTLGIQPEEELSCATMAGLLLERLGHIPAAGESLFSGGTCGRSRPWTACVLIKSVFTHSVQGTLRKKVNKNTWNCFCQETTMDFFAENSLG